MAHRTRIVSRSLALLAITALAACAGGGSAAVEVTRTGLVTMNGEPITLEGRGVKVGEVAPDFVAVAIDQSEQKLSEYRGVTVILSCVPSLESAVCDKETRTFNEKALALPENAVVLTVSMDLPSVQKRWCGTRGIVRVITLSDARHGEVGRAFGLRMRENGRLARAVYVIDAEGVVRYEELVKEVATEPNYAAAMAAAQNAAIGH